MHILLPNKKSTWNAGKTVDRLDSAFIDVKVLSFCKKWYIPGTGTTHGGATKLCAALLPAIGWHPPPPPLAVPQSIANCTNLSRERCKMMMGRVRASIQITAFVIDRVVNDVVLYCHCMKSIFRVLRRPPFSSFKGGGEVLSSLSRSSTPFYRRWVDHLALQEKNQGCGPFKMGKSNFFTFLSSFPWSVLSNRSPPQHSSTRPHLSADKARIDGCPVFASLAVLTNELSCVLVCILPGMYKKAGHPYCTAEYCAHYLCPCGSALLESVPSSHSLYENILWGVIVKSALPPL